MPLPHGVALTSLSFEAEEGCAARSMLAPRDCSVQYGPGGLSAANESHVAAAEVLVDQRRRGPACCVVARVAVARVICRAKATCQCRAGPAEVNRNKPRLPSYCTLLGGFPSALRRSLVTMLHKYSL